MQILTFCCIGVTWQSKSEGKKEEIQAQTLFLDLETTSSRGVLGAESSSSSMSSSETGSVVSESTHVFISLKLYGLPSHTLETVLYPQNN